MWWVSRTRPTLRKQDTESEHTEQQLGYQLVESLVGQPPGCQLIDIEGHFLQFLGLVLAELAQDATQIRIRAVNLPEQALDLGVPAKLAHFLLHDFHGAHIA